MHVYSFGGLGILEGREEVRPWLTRLVSGWGRWRGSRPSVLCVPLSPSCRFSGRAWSLGLAVSCTVQPRPRALHWSPEASALRGGCPAGGHAAETGSGSDHNQIFRLHEPLSRSIFLTLQKLPDTGGITLLHPFKGGQILFTTHYFIKPV